MKQEIIAAVLIMPFLAAAAVADITAEKIHEDVLVVSGNGGNVTAFRTDSGLLIIDTFITPAGARTARQLIEEAFPGTPVVYVINTHYHFDHVAGNMVYKDAVLVAHINNSDRVRTDYAERAAELAGADEKLKELQAHAAQHAGVDTEEAENLEKELQRLKSIRDKYGDFELLPAPFSLKTGARIELGEKAFHIWYHGPAHTDGDLIIYNPETRVLVMGDLLFNRMVPYIDAGAGADVPNWISILQKMILKSADYDIVVSGHGAVGDVEALKEKARYLTDLWNAVAAAHAAGKTLDEAKSEITLEQYSGYGRFQAVDTNIEACWSMLEK